MNIIKPCRTALVALSIWPAFAQAQTPMPMTPPTGVMPKPPVPQSAVDQAERQAQGQFTPMQRSIAGGQIQEAWDDADETAGVVRFNFCGTCSYKVRLRQHMVTVLELPKGEVIERADVGDKNEFDVQQRAANRLSIKPAGFGVDSNLMIYGKTGTVYPIYLRSESFNSVNVPDLLVRIGGTIEAQEVEVAGIGQATNATVGKDGHVIGEATAQAQLANIPPLTVAGKTDAIDGLENPDPGRTPGDFVQEAPFDPDTLRGWGEYEIWGEGANVDDLKPLTVFRDDYFTYLRFGEKWKDIELPTAYVVVDEIDELVNTRVQGKTYIVESTQRLITLKSGQTYICIKYTGAI